MPLTRCQAAVGDNHSATIHWKHLGVERVLLPEQDSSEPLLSRFVDEMPTGQPVRPAVFHPTPHRMLLTDAEQIMSAPIPTQLDQRRRSILGIFA